MQPGFSAEPALRRRRVGMSHSRIVPAFFLVALVHVILIAGFVTTASAPPSHRVRSEAMMAQLLQSAPTSTHSPVAVPLPLKPPRAQATHTALRASAEIAAGASPRPTSPRSAPEVRPRSANARDSIAPGGDASHQSGQPPKQAVTDSGASPALAAAAPPAAPTNAASAAAPETIAQAPAEPVDHADCRIAKPTYPEVSKRRGETGTATVRFVVGIRGAVDDIALVKSSGFARLDEAAIEALHQSTCRPQLEHGSPVRASYVQAFMFGLDDD
jgi:periplasmic protein TonB